MRHIQSVLNKYCLKITGSHWEAEDLTQEALIRVLQVLREQPDRPISKAYLFRIAKNLWIDKQRKTMRQPAVPLTDAHLAQLAFQDNRLRTRELLETLAHRLPVSQTVILLLMDVFDFTARETAAMIDSTEGAVQAARSRARNKLRALAAEPAEADGLQSGERQAAPPATLFEALVDGLRGRNPEAIYTAYLRLNRQGYRIGGIHRLAPDKLYFTIEDLDGNKLMVST
ncbi:RNA polymerase sigma factor [Paenibacillus oleatilyticus]|uniref:RNA polymerase sigma factor n=1 Tax=Paenibacillus oleatilyticus TaxID=2594886 RepID=A0ABV4UWE7_9BACL